MISSRVSCEIEEDRTVTGRPCHENHELGMREGKTPRLCPSHPRWNSEAAFGLTGWKLWAIIAIVIVVVISASFVMLVGSMHPPADVYARATPAADALPEALLPDTICGNQCLQAENSSDAGYVDAISHYEGGIRIVVTRFDSTSAAQQLIYNGENYFSAMSGKHVSVNSGDKQWFTHNGGGEDSVFVWRKGVWVFEIYAPNADMVKQVAEEFPY